jgi:Sec-independent protein translocase protein TatA
MPRLKPNSKLAKAIRELKKAMAPRVPEQDSKKVLTGEQPQPKDVRERQTAKP